MDFLTVFPVMCSMDDVDLCINPKWNYGYTVTHNDPLLTVQCKAECCSTKRSVSGTAADGKYQLSSPHNLASPL